MINDNKLSPTALGDIDFFMNKEIKLQLDPHSNEVVYAIKALNPCNESKAFANELVYIGETLDFDKRIKEHIQKIQNGNYTQTCKYITPNMKYKVDYDIIKLASAPPKYDQSAKKRYLSHVECIYIEKYRTNTKGNYPSETGDHSGIYRYNYKSYV